MKKKKFGNYLTLLKMKVSEEEFLATLYSYLDMESLPSDPGYDSLSQYLFNEVLKQVMDNRKGEDSDSDSSSFTDTSSSSDSDSDNRNGSDSSTSESDSDDAPHRREEQNDAHRRWNAVELDDMANYVQEMLLHRAAVETLLGQQQQQQQGTNVIIEEVNDDDQNNRAAHDDLPGDLSDSTPSVNSVDWIVFHKHAIHTNSLQSCCASPHRGRKTRRALASP